jgi:two-component system, OmpR family, alkaline phosphatase synthesis response regulator PhoP
MRVLIVEDETSLREALIDLLEGAGHEAVAHSDGENGCAVGLSESFDLALLDVMLPGMDGIELCSQLTAAKPNMGIILLTAKGSEEDKVRGLGVGADDYVTKPFGAHELLARIEAVGRRTAASSGPEHLVLDGCELDLGMCRATREDRMQSLTAREAEILRYLHRNRTRAVSRGDLLEDVWEAPRDLQTRTVDMTIAKLRQKIERNPSQPRIVLTVKGVGYALGET